MLPATASDHRETGGGPTVSVVTVYYNRAEFVDESIRSVLAQDGVDFELIAVDDGSTDGTLDRLQAIRDPRFRVVAKANSGFVDALRGGIADARGRFIAIHGSGDISLPGRLAAQAALLDASPSVGIVGCHVALTHLGEGSAPFAPANGRPFRDTLKSTNLFTHGEVMFRRETYDQVGGYRSFFRFSQDRDLWLRMSRVCDYRIVEAVLYQREQRTGGVSTSADKVMLQKRFSELAVQCAETVDAGGFDLLDRYGTAAPMMMARSPRLARSLFEAGARFLINHGDPGGWRLIRAAIHEHKDLRIIAGGALLSACRNHFVGGAIVRPLLKRRKARLPWRLAG